MIHAQLILSFVVGRWNRPGFGTGSRGGVANRGSWYQSPGLGLLKQVFSISLFCWLLSIGKTLVNYWTSCGDGASVTSIPGQLPFSHYNYVRTTNSYTHIWSRAIPAIYRWFELQIDASYPDEYAAMHARWRLSGNRIETRHAKVKHVREQELSNKHILKVH